MNAAEELQRALVRLAAAGGRPRCGDWSETSPWLADDPRLRELAAKWCAGCPVIVECDAAAVENKERFGVWGGRDRTKRERKGN